MSAELYPSDLKDEEWALLEPLLATPSGPGHPQVYDLRRIVDAIFYLLRTGLQWRFMPRDYPPWSAVYYHYAKWRRDDTWERVNRVLRERHRAAVGRAPEPSAAVIDSPTVKTTEAGGPRGYDGGKRISGRKRHVLVDTQGNLLKAKVHPADIHDRRGAVLLLAGLGVLFPTIALMWGDTAYRGLQDWLKETLGWTLAITRHLVDWGARRLASTGAGAAGDPGRVPRPAAPVGGRADARLARPQPPPRQGLRAPLRDRRHAPLPRHEQNPGP